MLLKLICSFLIIVGSINNVSGFRLKYFSGERFLIIIPSLITLKLSTFGECSA